jgi:hypothetical protein
MPLYSVLVCENFPLWMLGTVIGGIGQSRHGDGRWAGFDLRYLRQLRMALHRLLGRWTWRHPNRADVQTICQDRGSIPSRACITGFAAPNLTPPPVWSPNRWRFFGG